MFYCRINFFRANCYEIFLLTFSDWIYVVITGREMKIVSDGTAKICQKAYSYPIDVINAVGGLIDNKIVICGGEGTHLYPRYSYS